MRTGAHCAAVSDVGRPRGDTEGVITAVAFRDANDALACSTIRPAELVAQVLELALLCHPAWLPRTIMTTTNLSPVRLLKPACRGSCRPRQRVGLHHERLTRAIEGKPAKSCGSRRNRLLVTLTKRNEYGFGLRVRLSPASRTVWLTSRCSANVLSQNARLAATRVRRRGRADVAWRSARSGYAWLPRLPCPA